MNPYEMVDGEKREEWKRKIGKASKEIWKDKELRKRVSESRKGENHPMYGKCHTDASKKKMSEAKKDKYIEFIGDSLSCGMGNLGKKGVENPQTSRWEDVTLAYTYGTADELCVDYSIVSESGIGLAGSWWDPLFDFYSAWSYKRDKNLKYDFARVPDLIVINLGTNDFYLNCDLKICSIEEVIEKTKEFIAFVRSSYGKDVPIVWVSRFMFLGESYVNAIDKAISDFGGERLGIYRLDVPTSSGGAHGHPDVAGHSVARDLLVEFIKEKNLL